MPPAASQGAHTYTSLYPRDLTQTKYLGIAIGLCMLHIGILGSAGQLASASDFDGIEQCVTIASEESVIHACTHDDFAHMSMSVGLMRRRVARISAGSLHIAELS